MAISLVDIGVEGNDGTGDSIRESFRKVNSNFQELYTTIVDDTQVAFTDLTDAPAEFAVDQEDANKMVAVNMVGNRLNFKTIVPGDRITVEHTNSSVTISTTEGYLESDPKPKLGYHLNANNRVIANVANPDNVNFAAKLQNLNDTMIEDGLTPVTIDTVAIPKKYLEDHFYRNDEILYLKEHPRPFRFAPELESDDYQATTKYYVDNSIHTHIRILYVSQYGDDDQINTPNGKLGRSWNYSYRTIGAACNRIFDIITADLNTKLVREQAHDDDPEAEDYWNSLYGSSTIAPAFVIKVDGGAFDEHFPIRVPPNTTIIGSGTRNTLIRPDTTLNNSRSKWANLWFHRDSNISELEVVTDGTSASPTGFFGHHYLHDPGNSNSLPKSSSDIDAFLVNDSSGIRDLTIRTHNSFAIVLDPDANIISKPPVIANVSCLSQESNQHKFYGGVFIDGSAGRLTSKITDITSATRISLSNIKRIPHPGMVSYRYDHRYIITDIAYPLTQNGPLENIKANSLFIQEQVLGYLISEYLPAEYPNYELKKHLFRQYTIDIIYAILFDIRYGGNIKTLGFVDTLYLGTNPIANNTTTLYVVMVEMFTYLESLLKDIADYVRIPNEEIYQTIESQVGSFATTNSATAKTRIQTLVRTTIKNTFINGIETIPDKEYPEYNITFVNTPNLPLLSNDPDYLTFYPAGRLQINVEGCDIRSSSGHGILVTNMASAVINDTSTYFCWSGFQASNGSTINATGCTNNNGVYGLISEGNEVTETKDAARLKYPMVQTAKIRKPLNPEMSGVGNDPSFDNYPASGIAGAYYFYIIGHDFPPYNESRIEILHPAPYGLKTYRLTNITDVSFVDENDLLRKVLRVQISDSLESNLDELRFKGLYAPLTHGDLITIYSDTITHWINVDDPQPEQQMAGITYIDDPNLNAPSNSIINIIDTNPLGESIHTILPNITLISRATTCQVSFSSAHGLSNGDRIRIVNITTGPSELNNNDYRVIVNSSVKISLYESYNNGTGMGVDPIDSREFNRFTPDNANPAYAILNGDEAIFETARSFDYARFYVHSSINQDDANSSGPRTLGSRAGDIRIAVEPVGEIVKARAKSGSLLFGWSGKVHRITNYIDPPCVTQCGISFPNENQKEQYDDCISDCFSDTNNYGILVISDVDEFDNPLQDLNTTPITGLHTPIINTVDRQILIRASLARLNTAHVYKELSIVTATAHQFNNVGSGVNNSHFNLLELGDDQANGRSENNAIELTTGRLFWTGMNQDGAEQHGPLISLDQGTRVVAIKANKLSLSGITSMQCKTGVEVNSFSADSDMEQNSDQTVSTQRAIKTYIDRRLGIKWTGGAAANKIGSGFMDCGGNNHPIADISMGGFALKNVKLPEMNGDAATKKYVDDAVKIMSNLDGAVAGQFLKFADPEWIPSDINNAVMALDSEVSDAHPERRGVSCYKESHFNVNNGFVELQYPIYNQLPVDSETGEKIPAISFVVTNSNGAIVTTAITTTGPNVPGTFTGDWTLTENSSFNTNSADIAEFYKSDLAYEPGTVLVFGGSQEVTITSTKNDQRVAGVVSTNPAFSLGVNIQGLKVNVALQGRVPTKVTGVISKGDIMVTAAKPGYAVADNNTSKHGTIIGKALEDHAGGDGVIEIAVGRC